MDASQITDNPVPGRKPLKLADVRIEESTIKVLMLDDPCATRQTKRKLARQYKVNWKVYIAIQEEVRRRKFFGLDQVTGLKNATDQGNNKNE